MSVVLRILAGFLAATMVMALPSAAQGPSSALPSAAIEVAQAVPRPAPPPGPTAAAAGEQGRAAVVNNWTVGIAGGFFEGTFIRFAAELAKALDDGDNLRILPIVSYGGNRNIHDLLYLKGVDVAIAYTDTMELYKKSGQYRNIENRINYVSELLTGELYIYGRPEINRLQDLDGKKVSLGLKGSSATTTAPIVFERLGIQPEFVYLSGPVAYEKMKTGEIAAIASTGGKPNDLFVKLKPEPGYHFVPVQYSPKFADYYLPCPLTHADYPHLIPVGQQVDTLCMSAVLAVYNFPKNSDRFRRIERFIHYFFDRFESLKQPSFHPKWKEINLAAQVPGWNRYWVATEKLAAMPKVPPKGMDLAIRAQAEAITSGQVLEQDALFKEFMAWRDKHGIKR